MSEESEAGEGRTVPSAADTPDDAVDAVVDGDSVDQASVDEPDISLSKEPKAQAADDEDADLSSDVDLQDADDEADQNGSVRESALVGASAGSARAAARRSGVRAGTTASKGTATRPRDTGRDTRLNVFARLRRFLREVVAELRKVIWPARNQMVTYTIVVIVFVVFMVALTAGLDVLFAKGVLAVFG